MNTRLLRLVAMAIAFGLIVIACGDDDGAPATTEPVVFGEGEVPETVPEGFPIPPNASIGTTLVDKVNNRTEFRLTVTSDMESTIRFFQVGLVNEGYVITSSEGSAAEWTMTFSLGELTGQIFTTPQTGGSVTTSVISFNTS